ncbi:probable Gim, beta subunit [Thermoplasma acidophilum]|uniref:Prefoldin subunit beta n=1 Tax=Thermoplasma acidophilum (strain ATCC 25905 / DSM 1728 / JCM 9062 / NBRC 15155 / AMRC-C165) TaxID=273075 RepID=PFDB_THEAC|nr:prefoldin subunit beta [Thermoplasma acidophilum]Q9HJ36.1 RecName: Full=Prefoldin subunit beta; AltName: Full=GimC subunit beta [Thermoplasma acidophilum DSM 1728]MCY0851869.1 prefoldin subunit beta [Thermoplasma acidophilum]CAC12263.1 probable Gim, beta subunit [Thermoplasma acidophilum]
MVEPNISAYLQNQLRQAQELEENIEKLATQRYQLDLSLKEMQKTLDELNKLDDNTPIYRTVGSILYRVQDKKKLVDELDEQIELTKIRLSTLEKQQKSLEEKYKELQNAIRDRYNQENKKGATS